MAVVCRTVALLPAPLCGKSRRHGAASMAGRWQGDEQLIIKTTKTTVTFPLEQVVKYTYTDATGISTPSAMGSQFSADGESITFTGLKPNTPVYLYTVAGQLLKTVTATGQSKTVVSVSRFPVGVYVVKANGVTFKITKR